MILRVLSSAQPHVVHVPYAALGDADAIGNAPEPLLDTAIDADDDDVVGLAAAAGLAPAPTGGTTPTAPTGGMCSPCCWYCWYCCMYICCHCMKSAICAGSCAPGGTPAGNDGIPGGGIGIAIGGAVVGAGRAVVGVAAGVAGAAVVVMDGVVVGLVNGSSYNDG